MTAGPDARGAMICSGCAEAVAIVTSRCPDCGVDPLLDGRYCLLEVLGRGNAGTTYKAQSVETGRIVAIKELPLRPGDSPKGREMFVREAAVLRQLHHPAIPRYVDEFEAGRGKLRAVYLVREYIEGHDLAHELQHHRYTAAEVLDIADELLGVLGYLHALSPPVIHRDLKPANVIRRASDRRLVVVDFGSVRDCLQDEDIGGSTVSGTFGYMAPEQFRGDAQPATDLYGLGALAVCLLTRREPHTMLTPNGRLDWERHTRVDVAATTLLAALLHADPNQRPPNALQVRRWLGAVRRAPRDLPLPPIPGQRAAPLVTRRSQNAIVSTRPPPHPWGGQLPATTTGDSLSDAVPLVGMAIGLATGLGLLAMLMAMLMTVLGLVLI